MKSAQVACHTVGTDVRQHFAGNGAEIRQDFRPVCIAKGRRGQAAVAVDDGRQTLGQLQVAEMRPEHRRVGMAVDVDKAGRHQSARCVNGAPRGGSGQHTDGGNFAALYRHIGAARRAAGAVDDHTAAYQQIIYHGVAPPFCRRSLTVNRVERSSLSQRMAPLCSCTMLCAMARPKPKPSPPERDSSAR